MSDIFARTRLVLGDGAMEKLAAAHVAVFGAGGVGGHVIEALARSGVGAIDIVDNDIISESNINRQIIALHSTLGRFKSDVAAQRANDINPQCRATSYKIFFLPENKAMFDFGQFDYVVDAVDTVTAKLALIECANEADIPIISSMGTGNKTDPSQLEVADIYETSVCPLAKVVRGECRKRGIKRLKVVYSREEPVKAAAYSEDTGKPIPGSTAFVPPAAGLLIAREVILDIAGRPNPAQGE